MAESEGLGSGLEQQLTKGKIGGIPVWGVSVILAAALIGFLWWRNRNQTAKSPSTSEPDFGSSSDTTGSNVTNDPIGDWLAQNPTSSAYPVTGTGGLATSTPITNQQWARLAEDQLIGKGNDPVLVTNALSKYLQGASLTEAEKAIVDLALRLLGSPPEGVIPITVGGTLTYAKRKQDPDNHDAIRYKATETDWTVLYLNQYTNTPTASGQQHEQSSILAHYNGMGGATNPKGKTIRLPQYMPYVPASS